MHDYAIDAAKRRRVNEIILVLYILCVFWIVSLEKVIGDLVCYVVNLFLQNRITSSNWVYLDKIVSIILPGIGIGLIYFMYDHWLWKCKWIARIHKIPNLNGKWVAEVESPLKGDYKPKIGMEIKQTWNKIQVNGMSEVGTSTVSDSASLLNEHGQVYFRYSYWIHKEGEPHYAGFNSLKVTEDGLRGEYFSAKNVEKDLERECLHMIEKETIKKQIIERVRGCGSKGMITFKRV